MPTAIIKSILFISSYAPLFLISAALALRKNITLAFILAETAMFSWFILELFIFFTFEKINPEKFTVDAFQKKNSEALSYVVTYLFPFMIDFSKSYLEMAAFLVLFILVGFLYINSNMIHMNPILNLRGWHIYDTTLPSGVTQTILVKSTLHKRLEIDVVAIGENIYIEIEKSKTEKR
jgi:hypothetical protein